MWREKNLIQYAMWHVGMYNVDDPKLSRPSIQISDIELVTRALRLYRVTVTNKSIVNRALREIEKKKNKWRAQNG
jgi:Arc/MetJ family transcription regulator